MSKAKFTSEQLMIAVRDSFSIAAVIKSLGLKVGGANYKDIKLKIRQLKLDTSHFTGQGHLRGRTHAWSVKRPLQSILVINSTYTNTSMLKKRLIKEGLLKDICSECGISNWLGKTLALHLDHINGKHLDHRLENLRLLCPNCHSQTATYAGRNKRK